MASGMEARVSIDGAVATITFVTEGGINVMSSAGLERLAAAVEEVREAITKPSGDQPVRFLAVRAEGKVFVAGADIKEMSGFDRKQAHEFSVLGNRIMDSLAALPCISVALLHGAALGGGCEVALACDFRVAVESAKVGLPETSLGLIPGWGGTQRALKLVGPTWARRLIWSAAPVSADDAQKIGLVDEVVSSAEELDAAFDRMRKMFTRGGPDAIGLAKRAFLTANEPSAFADCFEGDESREGMKAFIEKRQAQWAEG